MEKKYIVKEFGFANYWCGNLFKWSDSTHLVEYFDTIEDAEGFISKEEKGVHQIETIYVNK